MTSSQNQESHAFRRGSMSEEPDSFIFLFDSKMNMTDTPVLIAEPFYMKVWAGKGTSPRALIPAPQAHKTFYIDDGTTPTVMYLYNGTSWVEVG